MAENIKEINMLPNVSLLPKLGKTGYRFSEALSEFIENSLDARGDGKVTIKVQVGKNEISISDDAIGMNLSELERALKLAETKKKNKKKFGEFGLGLKTAATAMGQYFQIKTSKEKEENWHIFIYDENKWLDENSWNNKKVIEFPKDKISEQGTIITIKKLNYSFYYNLVTKTKTQLAERFSRYIKSGELILFVNEDKLLPVPLDLIEFEGKKEHTFSIKTKENEEIKGWYGAKVKRSIGGKYGFDLLKENRIVEKDVKFGFEPHPEVARLVGEVHLNFVPVTHNKKSFIEESDQYDRALQRFKEFLKERNILPKIREIKEEEEEKQVQEKIYEHLGKNLPKNFLFEHSPKIIEIEEPKITENKKLSEIFVNGINYKYSFSIVPFDTKDTSSASKIVGKIVRIYINTEFPLYATTKDKLLYATFFIADELARRLNIDYKLGQEHSALRDKLLLTLMSKVIE